MYNKPAIVYLRFKTHDKGGQIELTDLSKTLSESYGKPAEGDVILYKNLTPTDKKMINDQKIPIPYLMEVESREFDINKNFFEIVLKAKY